MNEDATRTPFRGRSDRHAVSITRLCLRTGSVRLPYALSGRLPEGEILAFDMERSEPVALLSQPPRDLSGLDEYFSQHELQVNDQLVLELEGHDLRVGVVKRPRRSRPKVEPSTWTSLHDERPASAAAQPAHAPADAPTDAPTDAAAFEGPHEASGEAALYRTAATRPATDTGADAFEEAHADARDDSREDSRDVSSDHAAPPPRRGGIWARARRLFGAADPDEAHDDASARFRRRDVDPFGPDAYDDEHGDDDLRDLGERNRGERDRLEHDAFEGEPHRDAHPSVGFDPRADEAASYVPPVEPPPAAPPVRPRTRQRPEPPRQDPPRQDPPRHDPPRPEARRAERQRPERQRPERRDPDPHTEPPLFVSEDPPEATPSEAPQPEPTNGQDPVAADRSAAAPTSGPPPPTWRVRDAKRPTVVPPPATMSEPEVHEHDLWDAAEEAPDHGPADAPTDAPTDAPADAPVAPPTEPPAPRRSTRDRVTARGADAVERIRLDQDVATPPVRSGRRPNRGPRSPWPDRFDDGPARDDFLEPIADADEPEVAEAAAPPSAEAQPADAPTRDAAPKKRVEEDVVPSIAARPRGGSDEEGDLRTRMLRFLRSPEMSLIAKADVIARRFDLDEATASSLLHDIAEDPPSGLRLQPVRPGAWRIERTGT